MPRYIILPLLNTETPSAAEHGMYHSGRTRMENHIRSRWVPTGYVYFDTCISNCLTISTKVQGLGNPGGPQNPVWVLVSLSDIWSALVLTVQ